VCVGGYSVEICTYRGKPGLGGGRRTKKKEEQIHMGDA